MKNRYGYDAHGKLKPIAKIYTKGEHPVTRALIDSQARAIVSRLEEKGYEAYIVGGALRDILLGQTPKDFDIATSAHPSAVKRLFRRARIIGKRFRIVLITLDDGSAIEITTFRSNIDSDDPYGKSMFGTMDQDVLRRDFTCNALYYSPAREELVDYKNGVSDIKKRRLVPIRKEFKEDPVRMLRALKFSAKCGLKIPLALNLDIRKNAALLTGVSLSRMTEEIMKVLTSKSSAEIIKLCVQYKLLKYMLPRVYAWVSAARGAAEKTGDKNRLETLLENCARADAENGNSRSRALSFFIRAFTEAFIDSRRAAGQKFPSVTKLFEEVKRLLHPITPPNADIYEALRIIVVSKGAKMHESSRAGRKEYTREYGREQRDTRGRAGNDEHDDEITRARRRRRRPRGGFSRGGRSGGNAGAE